MRIRLLVEYHGGLYVGWQRQANGRSVQEAIEDAVRAVTGERVTLHGAGRTDTGVHATGQVAHFDLDRSFEAQRMAPALNAHLRDERIVVLRADEAPDGFHTRFSATGRRYRYTLVNRRAPLAFDRDRAWHVSYPLDIAAMREAARTLLGHHDFSTFRAANCQARSPMRTLDRLDVAMEGERLHVDAAARSFLHNQVRSMVGSLVEVGRGRWSLAEFTRRFAGRDRRLCGPVAPPQGLVLVGVDYSDGSGRPAPSTVARATS